MLTSKCQSPAVSMQFADLDLPDRMGLEAGEMRRHAQQQSWDLLLEAANSTDAMIPVLAKDAYKCIGQRVRSEHVRLCWMK